MFGFVEGSTTREVTKQEAHELDFPKSIWYQEVEPYSGVLKMFDIIEVKPKTIKWQHRVQWKSIEPGSLSAIGRTY
jgi:hypothetical protein